MRLSLDEARRIALAAQGFDRPRPRRVTAAHVGGVIRKLGLLQVDFVNVVIPSHYLVLYSRLGPYRTRLLDGAVYRRREFTEQWAHERSIVPLEHWPLLRHRRAAHRVRPWGFEKFLHKHPDYVAWVLEEVRRRGPLSAESLEHPPGSDRRIAGSWIGTVPRATLEAHFGRGALAVAECRANFSRTYDLAERIVPSEHFAREVPPEEAGRGLLAVAARACGVATAADLADYYRMSAAEARPRIAELVAARRLREVQVEGWRETAYLDPGASAPKRVQAAALLSPFDPLIWFRKRAARLFAFDHRFEIFVPQPKRRWGVYVLPFLLGDRLVARVDLKADREGGRLRALAAFLEPHARAGPVAEALAAELRTLCGWLGLQAVEAAPRGNLARPLAHLLKQQVPVRFRLPPGARSL